MRRSTWARAGEIIRGERIELYRFFFLPPCHRPLLHIAIEKPIALEWNREGACLINVIESWYLYLRSRASNECHSSRLPIVMSSSFNRKVAGEAINLVEQEKGKAWLSSSHQCKVWGRRKDERTRLAVTSFTSTIVSCLAHHSDDIRKSTIGRSTIAHIVKGRTSRWVLEISTRTLM